jgi:hypothetical protein
LTVTVHVSPLHVPTDHPPNPESLSGAAVSVTDVPASYRSTQSLPQLIPAGLLVTDPPPPPALSTVSCGFSTNVAVTDFESVMVTLQVSALPPQAPLQPPNTEFWFGCAVSVTFVSRS